MALCRFGLLKKSLPYPPALPSFLLAMDKGSHSYTCSHESNSPERKPFPSSFAVLKHNFIQLPRNPPNVVHYTQKKPTCIDESQSLNSITIQSLSRYTASQYLEKEYKCPSRLPEIFSQLIILDNVTPIQSYYDCPVSSSVVDSIKAPSLQKSEIMENPSQKAPAMEAKIIMKIRHKKMKKHKLRKLRKRMYFLWRKQKLARRAKRMLIYNKELAEIKKSGEDFDAEEFIREQLAKARKGGYYRTIL